MAVLRDGDQGAARTVRIHLPDGRAVRARLALTLRGAVTA